MLNICTSTSVEKNYSFLPLSFSFFFLQACNWAKPITLRVTVSNDVCRNSQWVYWFSVLGNKYNIEDSCFLAKGQRSFTMKKVIPDMNEDMLCWLTFSKQGPQQALLILKKGEDVKLTIDKEGITETEGSPENKEWYNYRNKARKVRKKIDSLTNKLWTTKDSLTRKHLSDRINSLKDTLHFTMRLEEFKNLETPKMFLSDIRFDVNGFSQKTVDSLVMVMKQRFPNNKRVQEYPRSPKYPPATLHSKQVHKRLLQIRAKRTGRNYKRPAISKLSVAQKQEVSLI